MAYIPKNRRDFYVSATGNDSSDGSVSLPKDADFSGYLQDYKLLATSGCLNTGLGTLAGYTFPTADFWGGLTPEGTINIGPHELVG